MGKAPLRPPALPAPAPAVGPADGPSRALSLSVHLPRWGRRALRLSAAASSVRVLLGMSIGGQAGKGHTREQDTAPESRAACLPRSRAPSDLCGPGSHGGRPEGVQWCTGTWVPCKRRQSSCRLRRSSSGGARSEKQTSRAKFRRPFCRRGAARGDPTVPPDPVRAVGTASCEGAADAGTGGSLGRGGAEGKASGPPGTPGSQVKR